MARKSYKIPTSLNKSNLDIEIALQNSDGVGLKPTPLSVILFYVIMIVILIYAETHFLAYLPISTRIIFGLLWAALTFFLGSFDKLKVMNLQKVPSLLSYLPKSERYLNTRRSDNAIPFYNFLGMDDIDDDGFISFADGTVGQFFMVTGSASILVFEEDKELIINRVNAFYQKIDSMCEIAFVTVKKGQEVHNQVRYLSELNIVDSDLKKLVEKEKEVLEHHVGEEFKSIHQYMLIKGDNKETFKMNRNVLASEVQNSSLMIKRCMQLGYESTIDLLSHIYKDVKVKKVKRLRKVK